MKTLYILIVALVFSFSTTYATGNTSENPTKSPNTEEKTSKTEEKNKNNEAKNNKVVSTKTVKVIDGAALHKLKFPKKYASKKTRYSYKK